MRPAKLYRLDSPRRRMPVRNAKNIPKPEPNNTTPKYFIADTCAVYPILWLFLKILPVPLESWISKDLGSSFIGTRKIGFEEDSESLFQIFEIYKTYICKT